jgi:hypothetical protein
MTNKTRRLRAPAGADEANYGTERFRVDNSGVVEVPEEAVESLLHTGGFAEIEDEPPVPAGLIYLAHPEGVGCSFGGVSYEPDDKGRVTVPIVAVSALGAHGFAIPTDPTPPVEPEVVEPKTDNETNKTPPAAGESGGGEGGSPDTTTSTSAEGGNAGAGAAEA